MFQNLLVFFSLLKHLVLVVVSFPFRMRRSMLERQSQRDYEAFRRYMSENRHLWTNRDAYEHERHALHDVTDKDFDWCRD